MFSIQLELEGLVYALITAVVIIQHYCYWEKHSYSLLSSTNVNTFLQLKYIFYGMNSEKMLDKNLRSVMSQYFLTYLPMGFFGHTWSQNSLDLPTIEAWRKFWTAP